MKTDSWYHSSDGNAPKWPAPRIEYEHNTITDYVLDDNQDDHVVKIDYVTFIDDDQLKLAELKVTTKANYPMLEEDVLGLLSLHEGRRVYSDCKIEIVKP